MYRKSGEENDVFFTCVFISKASGVKKNRQFSSDVNVNYICPCVAENSGEMSYILQTILYFRMEL